MVDQEVLKFIVKRYVFESPNWASRNRRGNPADLSDNALFQKIIKEVAFNSTPYENVFAAIAEARLVPPEPKVAAVNIKTLIAETIDKLPIRLLGQSEATGGSTEYYLLMNPTVNREVLYYPGFKSDQSGSTMAKIFRREVLPMSESICRGVLKWEKDILAQITDPKVLKTANPLADALDMVHERSEFPQMYINSLHNVSDQADQYCLKYLQPDQFQPGPTPLWDEFLSRICKGCKYDKADEVFMACVWSFFEPGNKSRSAIWLHGEDGKDGKSTVSRVIARIMGFAQTASISQDSYSNQFFYSFMFRKVLTVFSDCKNSRLISESKIHNMLGQDIVSIEYKGRTSFAGQMLTKLWVNSNIQPELTRVLHELSRVIYFKIASASDEVIIHGSASYEDDLFAETPAFLAKCRVVHPKYCKFNADIELPRQMILLRKQCIGYTSFLVDRFFEDKFVWEESDDPHKSNLTIPQDRLQDIASAWIKQQRQKHPTLKAIFLQREIEGMVQRRAVRVPNTNGNSEWIWRGIALKGEALNKRLEQEMGL